MNILFTQTAAADEAGEQVEMRDVVEDGGMGKWRRKTDRDENSQNLYTNLISDYIHYIHTVLFLF